MKMESYEIRASAVRVDKEVIYVRMETPGETEDDIVRIWWMKTNKAEGMDSGIALQLTALKPEIATPFEEEFLKRERTRYDA